MDKHFKSQPADGALRKKGELFQGIFEHAPDAMLAVDKDGMIVMANNQAEIHFGWNREELIGNPVEILIPDRFTMQHIAYRNEFIAKPRTRPMGEGRGLYAKRRDGSEFPVSISLSSVGEGDETLALAMVRDITTQKETERKIQDLNWNLALKVKELETSNNELASFSYSVSHDLRAPVRGIMGFSSALLEEHSASFNDEQKEFLNRIRDASRKMGELIDGLIGLSQLSRSEVRSETVNISNIAREVFRDYQANQPGRKVQVTVADSAIVQGDPALLRSVFVNLIGNAWKFTTKSANAEIEFGIRPETTRTVYFVRDNGAGFDMRYSNKLFGNFQRLHSEKEYSGTGIGLATVNRIIQRHGGKIWAEGEVGKGATFYFTLPLPPA